VQEENGLKLDVELTGTHLREVVRRFKVCGPLGRCMHALLGAVLASWLAQHRACSKPCKTPLCFSSRAYSSHCFHASSPSLQGVYEKEGKSLPNDPYEQMRLAINAVFGSWNTPRAVKYR
jgi:hypothetical protein